MKTFPKNKRILIVSLLALLSCLSVPRPAYGQTEKLGMVAYTPPRGWNKTLKENVVGFSRLDQTAGTFCIITLYGATPGTGSPAGDFSRDWNKFVVSTMKAEADPKTETQVADGWTITAGGSEVESGTGKAVAFLTVINGAGRTISVLGVFNEKSYLANYEAFVGSLDIEKAAPAAAPPAAAPPAEGGKLIIPPTTRQITIADLVGEWGETARFSTTYVYRSSGSYAGSDTLAFRSKMSFTANGRYLNDFFAIRNGEKIIDKTVGTVAISGAILFIKHKSTAKYVMRGWLDLPDATVLTVCGPWFDDDEIPARVFSDPEYGVNLNKNWVRRK